MTTTDTPTPTAPHIGTRMVRREDAPLLTGEAKYTADLPIPGALHLAVLRSPVRPRPHHLDRRVGRARPPRRGRGLHRRGPRRQLGQPDAVGLGRHRGHEEPAPLPAGHRHGELRRRRCRGGAGRERRPGPRRARGHRRRLRPAACRGRPRRRPQRPRAGARGARHQLGLHVGAEDRRRGVGPGLRRRHVHGEGALRAAAPHRHGHGASGRRGRPPALRRRHDAVQRHPDPPHPEGDGLHHPRNARAPAAGGGTVGGRRLRLEARGLRRGAAVPGAGRQAPRAGALGRGAHRGHPVHRAGPRPDPGDRAGRRRRRQAHRHPGEPHRRHGRLPDAHHRRRTAAGGVPLRRGLRPARGLLVHLHRRVHHHDADRRVPRRRPARGHLRHRAGHGPPRPGHRHRPGRAAPPQLHQEGAVPLHRLHRSGLRLGRSRGCARQGPRHGRLRRVARRAAARGAQPVARPTSASACRPTSRCAAWRRRGCWRR